MAKYRVGSVPYVNAHPLVWGLEDQGVSVVYDVPSKLPTLLDSGEVDAILVSSIESIRRSELETIGDVAIISAGVVDSVRIFSKIAWGEIESLALDQSSMTSNALALMLLDREVDSRPMVPDLEEMLTIFDAGLLIGDRGMDQEGEGLFVYDLGEIWNQKTGLPFVWALWTVRRGANFSELGSILNQAYERAKLEWDEMIEFSILKSGWSEAKTRRYLQNTMSYELDTEAKLGLKTYASKLAGSKLLDSGTSRITGTV
jgi:chorismate dehydratase